MYRPGRASKDGQRLWTGQRSERASSSGEAPAAFGIADYLLAAFVDCAGKRQNSPVCLTPLPRRVVLRRQDSRVRADREETMVHLQGRFGLGLEQESNRLADPNPLWPQAYAEEAACIRAALGEKALAIEHYGSTAVPGLRAKPIIDLQIGVADIEHALLFIEPMAELGYDHAGSQGIPDHYIFGKGRARTHLAHVVVYQGEQWLRCLRFRDRLRSDANLLAAYEGLKMRLAADPTMTRDAYTASKTSFINNASAPA
jgi:GrpB-like predicted nucleotidyltransferase (UPF0157 family)